MKIQIKLLVVIILVITIVVYSYYFLFYRNKPKIIVRIATTTSLYAISFLDHIANEFKKTYRDVELFFLAVGSGTALEYAERGDVCSVIVHAPDLEAKYLRWNIIENQRFIVYNFFVIAGPKDDPANISKADSIVDAFRRIYETAQKNVIKFVSRSDNSGTHRRELYVWRIVNADKFDSNWYLECGCGADQALLLADELNAYILTDESSYNVLKKKGKINKLSILYINHYDFDTINVYSMYLSKKCEGEERKYAELFQDFVYNNHQKILEELAEIYNTNIFISAKNRENDLLIVWEKIARGEVSD